MRAFLRRQSLGSAPVPRLVPRCDLPVSFVVEVLRELSQEDERREPCGSEDNDSAACGHALRLRCLLARGPQKLGQGARSPNWKMLRGQVEAVDGLCVPSSRIRGSALATSLDRFPTTDRAGDADAGAIVGVGDRRHAADHRSTMRFSWFHVDVSEP
jgi:hypothetical protein